MFVSFIQFIFDPYLDQFEARPGVASVAWLKIQVIVLSLTLSLSDPIFHHLCCVWWNVQGPGPVTSWQHHNDSRVGWGGGQGRDYRSGLILPLSCVLIAEPRCLLLPAPILLFSIFLIPSSGSPRHMADRPGIMTGLKRLLLIIFSLHNIKHHIICSEGEARGDVYYISQTGKEEILDQTWRHLERRRGESHP